LTLIRFRISPAGVPLPFRIDYPHFAVDLLGDPMVAQGQPFSVTVAAPYAVVCFLKGSIAHGLPAASGGRVVPGGTGRSWAGGNASVNEL
jgi:hypothetical protein